MLRCKGHTFSELKAVLPTHQLKGSFPTGEITGLTLDSREAVDGAVFFAVSGANFDGADFAHSAWENGASLVVSEREISVPEGKALVVVSEIRDAIADIAVEFSLELLKTLTIVGVTGTNGKTTTAHMIHSILKQAGRKSACIGTTGITLPDGTIRKLPNTTPDIITLLSCFYELNELGIDNFVLEVSSQGVVQRRVKGLPFRVGVFTNLTQEHMETHGSFEKYHEAKLRFFTEASPAAARLGKVFIGVVNGDSPHSKSFESCCPGPPFVYGKSLDCDVRAANIVNSVSFVHFDVASKLCRGKVSLSLPGEYNVYNALAAIGAGLSLAISSSSILDGLQSLCEVSGRLQKVGDSSYHVFVDYAHSSDALEKLLECSVEMAQSTGGRVILVFGCGGDRDRTKRPRMGSVANMYSDIVYITSDNPRTEDPHTIISEILSGIVEEKAQIKVESDRRSAIEHAIEECSPSDIVVIAGKGHEDYQILGTERIHFDDREIAQMALEKKAL